MRRRGLAELDITIAYFAKVVGTRSSLLEGKWATVLFFVSFNPQATTA